MSYCIPKLRDGRKRVIRLATQIYHRLPPRGSKTPINHIRVVCISDTHNSEPEIPAGEVLLHAGDLTMTGHFRELQKQLNWLDSHPHKYKVVIGGNHDFLLDSIFMERCFPDKGQIPGSSFADLNWGSIIYLRTNSVTLEFPNRAPLKIYGVPHTPEFGTFAFQHPRKTDIWTNTIPRDTDIVLTHGPPLYHLDTTHWGENAGSLHLLREVKRTKPKLVVFGHIHEGYGQKLVRFDRAEQTWETIVTGERATWLSLMELLFYLIVRKIFEIIPYNKDKGITRLVNAAMMEGHSKSASRAATVILL